MAAAAVAALLLLLPVASVAQTRPATSIVNVATAHTGDGQAVSNEAVLTVAERLDVALIRAPDADTVLASGERALGVTLVNRGTGDEAFAVALAGASGTVVAAADRTPLADGRTASLAPGASLSLLVVAVSAASTLSARAVTGSGTPGTLFAALGDGGSDAVVGPTGAAASLPLAGPAAEVAPTIEKSQAVLAPDGSATPVRGATITYQLVARFTGPATGAEIVDPVPAGTRFLPGSLALDGATLAETGRLVGGEVTVPLGPVAAGAVHTLRFQVVIL